MGTGPSQTVGAADVVGKSRGFTEQKVQTFLGRAGWVLPALWQGGCLTTSLHCNQVITAAS